VADWLDEVATAAARSNRAILNRSTRVMHAKQRHPNTTDHSRVQQCRDRIGQHESKFKSLRSQSSLQASILITMQLQGNNQQHTSCKKYGNVIHFCL
jgi:hypothetical protein